MHWICTASCDSSSNLVWNMQDSVEHNKSDMLLPHMVLNCRRARRQLWISVSLIFKVAPKFG